jgi:hypothetical protein
MLSLKNIFLPWRDPNPGLLFLRWMRRRAFTSGGSLHL